MNIFKKLFGSKQRSSQTKQNSACSENSHKFDDKSTLSTTSSRKSSLLDEHEDSFLKGEFHENRKTLVLDLDETLIHTQDKIPEGRFFPIAFEGTGGFMIKYIVPRPNMQEFLEEMSQMFNICIYTCGTEKYAMRVATLTGIEKYVYAIYSRSLCKKVSECGYEKDLWALGFDPQHTIFVDDNAMHTYKHPENSIQIKGFYGSESDQHLEVLPEFLKYLNNVSDIRPIAKNYNNFIDSLAPVQQEENATHLELIEDGGEEINETLPIEGIRVREYNTSKISAR